VTKKRRTAGRARPDAGATARGSAPIDRVPRPARAPQPARVAARRPVQTLVLLGVGAIVAIVAIAAVVLGQGSGPPTGITALRSPTVRPSSAGPTSGSGPSGAPTISGVRCDPTEQITFHTHAHLNIRVNGQLVDIPGDVGQRPTCIYWLHTHAAHGVIHIEAPAPTVFTLGQFFDVWGKPLDATHLADASVPAGSSIWVFIDGQQVTVDPRTIELGNLESIELQVGPAAIAPLPYTFPDDFR